MADGTYEMVLFRLKPGVDRDTVQAVSDQANTWLREQPGFLSREVLEDESGQWIDMLRWASLNDALAAAEAFTGTPVAAAYMGLVDEESIRMLHPRRFATYD